MHDTIHPSMLQPAFLDAMWAELDRAFYLMANYPADVSTDDCAAYCMMDG